LRKRADLHLQVVLLDDEARPGSIEQLVLADQTCASLDQSEQHVERARAKLRGNALLQELALVRADLEASESKRRGTHQTLLQPARSRESGASHCRIQLYGFITRMPCARTFQHGFKPHKDWSAASGGQWHHLNGTRQSTARRAQ
jgi:hypothetical protein